MRLYTSAGANFFLLFMVYKTWFGSLVLKFENNKSKIYTLQITKWITLRLAKLTQCVRSGSWVNIMKACFLMKNKLFVSHKVHIKLLRSPEIVWVSLQSRYLQSLELQFRISPVVLRCEFSMSRYLEEQIDLFFCSSSPRPECKTQNS